MKLLLLLKTGVSGLERRNADGVVRLTVAPLKAKTLPNNDLDNIRGSGDNGAVTKLDLENHRFF